MGSYFVDGLIKMVTATWERPTSMAKLMANALSSTVAATTTMAIGSKDTNKGKAPICKVMVSRSKANGTRTNWLSTRC